MARSAPVVEPFANISAQELLKNTPGLFGWVRKEETAGIRSMVKALDWPWRYMILSKGCLYLFKQSDDQNFCEAVPLSNFRVCNAPEKSKYPWVFKLIHTKSCDVKTLVFAVDTDFDLKKWQDAIARDMEKYCGDSSWADDADGYCSIDDDVPSKPPSRVQTFQLRERPPAPLPDTRRRHSCSFTSTDLRQKPLPSLPDISQKPLPPPPGHEKPEPARKPPPNLKPAILSRPPARATQPSPVTMGRFPGRSSDSSGLTPQGYENVINQLQKAKVNPTDMRGSASTLPPPPVAGPAALRKPIKLGRGDPDGQSFKVKHKEGVLPSSALLLDLDKTEVNSLLENKYGVYIVRNSQTAQSKMVLSVGTGDKVVHYRISYDEEQGYSLKEQGTPRFPEITDLLSHYSSFDLPTHDLKLTVAATYR
ncbi:SH3 domain-binding protein 2-like [Pocillopora damicornis]|uniref:SH3 domain-binding protein 2-like n=1 Tax=Pocillopora damicornis TaxID=46731 RepID=UPI000F54F221|nr:SH3 domain-binding protein 2-like [Pocillopora damicornis]